MSFFIHTLFMVSCVWMTLHFWRQLPLLEDETPAGRMRVFRDWTLKGVGAPLLVWMLMNTGLASWLPPFLPQVDQAKNSGSFLPWAVLKFSSPAMSVIVSFWAALSLLGLLLLIRERTTDRPKFHGTAVMWTAFMFPVCVVVLLISGWIGIGFALMVWFVPIVHGTLPDTLVVSRSPSYSQAIAKLKFGKYSEAEWEIIQELEQFENDFKGWMMLAELYAVHFNDFLQAEQTVIELCEQPEIQPSDACVALHRLADWYLERRNDPQGARRCMEAIQKRFPGTHLDRMAGLRLKRIPDSTAEWLDQQRGRPVHLPALRDDWEAEAPSDEADPARQRERAQWLSEKLTDDPNAAAAREEFARALARLGKFQPALEQLDLLLAMEEQPPSRRAEWMGLKAAWTARSAPGSAEVRALLERILNDFPDTPQAMAARHRLFQLDQQDRIARFAARKQMKPRIVIRMETSAQQDESPERNSG